MFKIYLAVCAISVIAKAEPQQAITPKFLTQHCNNKGNCKVDSTRIKFAKISCNPESGDCETLLKCNSNLIFLDKGMRQIRFENDDYTNDEFPIASCKSNETLQLNIRCHGNACLDLRGMEMIPVQEIRDDGTIKEEKLRQTLKIDTAESNPDYGEFVLEVSGDSTKYYQPKMICTSINNGIILSREIFQLGNGTVNMIRGGRKYSIKDGKFLRFYEKYSVSCTTYDVK